MERSMQKTLPETSFSIENESKREMRVSGGKEQLKRKLNELDRGICKANLKKARDYNLATRIYNPEKINLESKLN